MEVPPNRYQCEGCGEFRVVLGRGCMVCGTTKAARISSWWKKVPSEHRDDIAQLIERLTNISMMPSHVITKAEIHKLEWLPWLTPVESNILEEVIAGLGINRLRAAIEADDDSLIAEIANQFPSALGELTEGQRLAVRRATVRSGALQTLTDALAGSAFDRVAPALAEARRLKCRIPQEMIQATRAIRMKEYAEAFHIEVPLPKLSRQEKPMVVSSCADDILKIRAQRREKVTSDLAAAAKSGNHLDIGRAIWDAARLGYRLVEPDVMASGSGGEQFAWHLAREVERLRTLADSNAVCERAQAWSSWRVRFPEQKDEADVLRGADAFRRCGRELREAVK